MRRPGFRTTAHRRPRPAHRRAGALPGSVRRGYALGGIATGAFGTVPGLLLLPYLTDTLGVAAGIAGFIVFAPKAWDVVLNPVAGRISDRSTSPRGRRRPFLLRGGVALALAFALVFAGPTAPPAVAAVWVAALFLASATAFAFFQVPYVTMPAEITDDPLERGRLMTWRVVVLSLAILVSGAAAPLVVAAYGYPAMGVAVGFLLLAGSVGAYVGTRDTREVAPSAPAGSLAQQLRLVAGDPVFRALLGTFVVQSLAIGTMLAGVSFVSRHLLGDPQAATLLFVAFIGPALLVTPLWELLAARYGKRTAFALASVVLAVGAGGLWSAWSAGQLATLVAAAVAGAGFAGAQALPLSMLPDVAAAATRRTGENRAGVYAGVWTGGETLGLALGPGVYGLLLQLGGYVSSAGGVEQTDGARVAVALGFSVVPMALIGASLLFLRTYDLDERSVTEPHAEPPAPR